MSILGLDRIVDIDKRRKEIKAEDEKLKKERGPLQERILEALAGDGLRSVKTEAGVTVYTRSELWVRAKRNENDEPDYGPVCDVLERYPGLIQFSRRQFNVLQLSAWVREARREGEDLPKDLLAVVDIEDKHEIRTRG